MSKILAACIFLASQSHALPPAALLGILNVENGRPGLVSQNTNDTQDLGPMQINTVWVPEVARRNNLSEKQAYKQLRSDICFNVDTAAWILKSHLEETQNLKQAIAQYHSRTPEIGKAYKKRVLAKLENYGLVSGH